MARSLIVTQDDIDNGAGEAACPACDLPFLLGMKFRLVPGVGPQGEELPLHTLCIAALLSGFNPRVSATSDAD